MARILFLNCSSGLSRLGYALNDLKLKDVFEFDTVGAVAVPGLAEFVASKGISLVATMVHSGFPELCGCLATQVLTALRQDIGIEPGCFGHWVDGNLREEDPYLQAWHTGRYVECIMPGVSQVLVVFDHRTQRMHPVASYVPEGASGKWRKINMLWQNAVNIGFATDEPNERYRIPELHDTFVPQAFRPVLKANRRNTVLRQAAQACSAEGHGRMKTLVMTTVPVPVESIPKSRPWLGINGTPVFDAATVVYCPPDLAGWWIPQVEALLRERKPTTNYLLVARNQAEIAQLAGTLDGNVVFQHVLQDQMREGWIRSVLVN